MPLPPCPSSAAGAWLPGDRWPRLWRESPVKVFADTLNVAIDLDPDAEIDIDDGHRERALYILEGDAQLDGVDIPAQHLVIPKPAHAAACAQRHR